MNPVIPKNISKICKELLKFKFHTAPMVFFFKIISTGYHFILTTVFYKWILDFLMTTDQRNKTVRHKTKTVF